MRPDFELLAALFVDMRGTVHRKTLDAGRERNGAPHLRTGALGGVDDLACRIVENPVVEGFQPYADILILHVCRPSNRSACLLDDFRHDAGADGAAAFADGETK